MTQTFTVFELSCDNPVEIVVFSVNNVMNIVLMLVVVLSSSNMIILDSYQTHVSSPIIASDKTNYKQGEDITISGWVRYNDEPTSDVLLRVTATNPKEMRTFDEYTSSNIDGVFSIRIPIAADAEIGNYSIQVISQCREIHREVCTHRHDSLSINVESVSDQNRIPNWVRNNAAWWADGMISDFDFVKGIEYLVGSGTIRVHASSQIDPTSLEPDAGPSGDAGSENSMCMGNARCIYGTVERIVDGDILQIGAETVRFALVDTPKLKYDGGQARGFIEQICPVDSTVVVDQDDKQLEDKYGRILGVVYCNDLNLNKELLDLGLGDLYSTFCDQSEFSSQPWALKHGCES